MDEKEMDLLKQEDLLSKGYGIIPKLMMKDTRLSVESKAIYAYLCSYCGAGNTAFPSVDLICHDLEISERRYQKHLKQLKDTGYVTVTRERKTNGFSNNIYTLPKTVSVQNVSIRNVPLQNVPVQNDGTNINSLNINSLNKDNMSSSGKIPYSEIISYLNKVTNKKYKVTQKWKDLIKARWNEGQRLDDFKKVIDVKSSQWLNDSNMNKYLRPQTLFGNKFDDYLQEYREPTKPKQTKDDFEELEGLFGDPA